MFCIVDEYCQSCGFKISVTLIDGQSIYTHHLCIACREAVTVIISKEYWMKADMAEIKERAEEKKRIKRLRSGEDYFQ